MTFNGQDAVYDEPQRVVETYEHVTVERDGVVSDLDTGRPPGCETAGREKHSPRSNQQMTTQSKLEIVLH